MSQRMAACRHGRPARRFGDQTPADRGRDQAVAGRDRTHGVDQAVGVNVLQQEARGAGAQRAEDVLVQVEGGEYQHVGELFGDHGPGGRDSVQPRHPHVHQDQVRPVPAGQGHGLFAVGGLAHDLDVGRAAQNSERVRTGRRTGPRRR